MRKKQVNVWMIELQTVFDFGSCMSIDEDDTAIVYSMFEKIAKIGKLEGEVTNIIHFYLDGSHTNMDSNEIYPASAWMSTITFWENNKEKFSIEDCSLIMTEDQTWKLGKFTGWNNWGNSFNKIKENRPTNTKILDDLNKIKHQYEVKTLYFVDDNARKNVLDNADKVYGDFIHVCPNAPYFNREGYINKKYLGSSKLGIKGMIEMLDKRIKILENQGEYEG